MLAMDSSKEAAVTQRNAPRTYSGQCALHVHEGWTPYTDACNVWVALELAICALAEQEGCRVVLRQDDATVGSNLVVGSTAGGGNVRPHGFPS
jgi:hypothetical protein